MCAAAMGTVAPPLTFLLLLFHLAEGSFPEEPSPLSYVPIEGTCVCMTVCAALMNGFMLDVEIRGQGSEPWCRAALKLPLHTDLHISPHSFSQWQYCRFINMRYMEIKKGVKRKRM